jgi:addiction module HigA family antidote
MGNDTPAGRPGFRPIHPGRILKRNIDALGLTIEAFADHIGTTRQTVHAIIAGRSAVREEMAVRLARAFRTTPQFWLNLQVNHVVWEFERLQKLMRIRPVKGVAEGVVRNWRSGRSKASRRPKHQH